MNAAHSNDPQTSVNTAARSPRRSRKLLWIVAIVACAAAIALLAAGPIMSMVEQPKFKIIERAGPIEIRSYDAMIAAQTIVHGERKPSIEEGFRRIAAYIFGANSTAAKGAPAGTVTQQSSQKIAMTAPVIQTLSGEQDWTVSFIMPSSWTMDSLPSPNDARVTLRPVPAKLILAITFSGTASDGLIQAKTNELRSYANEQQLATSGEPIIAFYNPPWTLPMFRRNEIMLEIADGRTK